MQANSIIPASPKLIIMSPPFFCEYLVSKSVDISSLPQATAILSNGDVSRINESENYCKFPTFINGYPLNYTLRNILLNSLREPRLFWLSQDLSVPKDEQRWVRTLIINIISIRSLDY